MDARSQVPRSGAHRRTRRALLHAAADLLRAGREPSVADAAEAADVSRRTAYRYFPTQEQLLTEAALESLRASVEGSFSSLESEPFARLDAAVRGIQAETIKNEHLLRIMIRLTIERPLDEQPRKNALRGSRRIEWIESALQPVRKDLSKTAFARLVSALTLCVGTEALIVLRDANALTQQQAVEISAWSAKALLEGALREHSVGKSVIPRKNRGNG